MATLSAASYAWTDAVDICESAYQDSQGEVTERTEAAEALRGAAADAYLEHLARYIKFQRAQYAAQLAEISRIEEEAMPGCQRRIDWAEDETRRVLDSVGRRKSTAGPFIVSLQAGRHSVDRGELAKVDAAALPDNLIRWSEPVPARAAPDAKAILAHLKAVSANPKSDVLRDPDNPALVARRGRRKVVVR